MIKCSLLETKYLNSNNIIKCDIAFVDILKLIKNEEDIHFLIPEESYSTAPLRVQNSKSNLQHYFDEYNDVGNYRLHVYFDTFNYFELLDGGDKYRMTYFKIMNFKMTLGIWFGIKLRTSFDYYIESYDDCSDLWQRACGNDHITGSNVSIDTYYDRFPNIKAINDCAPYIYDYDVEVTNEKNCIITNSNFW